MTDAREDTPRGTTAGSAEEMFDRVARAFGLDPAVARTLNDPDDRGTSRLSETAFAICTRRLPPSLSPWAPDRPVPEFERVVEVADLADTEAYARHPHPAVRSAVARHSPHVEVVEALVGDEWREVRVMALLNPSLPQAAVRSHVDREPARALRGLAARVQSGKLDGSGVPCVECGGRVKRLDYFTCSVACSIDQFERRRRSGRWVDAVEADFRRRLGLRDAWPADFAWDVAHSEGSGGLPGAGPRKRRVLVSFVRAVSAGELVKLMRTLVQSGTDASHAVAVLTRLEPHIDSSGDLEVVARALQ